MALRRSERETEMIIDIKDSDKACITHALREAMVRLKSSIVIAFNNCHPDRQDLNWYKRIEDDICVMKKLKHLLDRLEEAKGGMK